MPDLAQESTPPPQHPAPPVPIGDYQPPPPFPWEDRAVFRETFLFYFTQPGVADSLRNLGIVFYDLVLNHYDQWPDWPESPVRAELRAAVADLYHLQGFLLSVWKSSEVSSVAAADLPLCQKALAWSRAVAKVAREIETELGPCPEK